MSQLAIFTDLDGTLLDASFRFDPALPLLRRLVAADVPVVPVTSKTRAEAVRLAEAMGLPGPLIVESGGGIVRRTTADWSMEPLALGADQLRMLATKLMDRCDVRLRFFAEMDDAEATRASGLSGEALALARRREFDLPFLLDRGSLADLRVGARAFGLEIHLGGRFLHLLAGGGKGRAVRRLLPELGRGARSKLVVVALGDSPMDAEFLCLADWAIVIPHPERGPDAELVRLLRDARIAPRPGPAGWADAVDQVWNELRASASSGAKRGSS